MNKTYKPEEYKKMPQQELIDLFYPMISNLSKKYGDNRFCEDIEQDCILALLRAQEKYTPTSKKSSFPYYAKMHLTLAAKNSKQQNFGSIYIPETQARENKNKQKMYTENVDDIYKLMETDNPLMDKRLVPLNKISTNNKNREDEMFTILKIILKQIKKSPITEDNKIIYKEYLRDFIENGAKSKASLNKHIKKMLMGTVLDKN